MTAQEQMTCILVSLAVLCLVSTPAWAQGNGKGNGNGGNGGGKKGSCSSGSYLQDPIPITIATFRDGQALPDRIQSDGAAYLGAEGSAQISCGGELTLRSEDEFGRMLFLDFGAPVGNDPPPCSPNCLRNFESIMSAPFTFGTNVLANPGDEANEDGTLVGGAWAMNVDDSRQSRLKLNFSSANGWLTLRFKPSEFTDTTSILVTRTSATTWTLEAAATDIAKLMTPDYLIPTKGKWNKGHDEGNYFIPFKLYVEVSP